MLVLILILSLFLPATTLPGYQDHSAEFISSLDPPKSLPGPQIKIVALPEDTNSGTGQITDALNGSILTILMAAAVLIVLIAVFLYFMVEKARKQEDEEEKPDSDGDSKKESNLEENYLEDVPKEK